MTNPHSNGMMHPVFITSGKQKHFCSFNKSFEARQFGRIYLGEYTSLRREASILYISVSGRLEKSEPAALWLKFTGLARSGGGDQ